MSHGRTSPVTLFYQPAGSREIIKRDIVAAEAPLIYRMDLAGGL
jgi:hypothetical protein